jgi:hypothetical protein
MSSALGTLWVDGAPIEGGHRIFSLTHDFGKEAAEVDGLAFEYRAQLFEHSGLEQTHRPVCLCI